MTHDPNEPMSTQLKPPKRKKAEPKPEPLAFHYRDHDGDHKRVWLSGWAGDAFEIIDNPSFIRFRTMLKRFGITIEDHNGDED